MAKTDKTEIYERLNKAWKTAVKVVFHNDDIGELKEYEYLLTKFSHAPTKRRSVHLWNDKYPKNARYIEYEKANVGKQYEPLNINEIKDIDSIVEALKERFVYTGDTLIGNNQYIEQSTNVNDSFAVYKSNSVIASKYVAYSSSVISSEYIFGEQDCGNGKFVIASVGVGDLNGVARLFNSLSVGNSSDIYFSHNVEGSQEVMFSFFVRGGLFTIGNMRLQKEKYFKLKEKLLEEITTELLDRKTFKYNIWNIGEV